MRLLHSQKGIRSGDTLKFLRRGEDANTIVCFCADEERNLEIVKDDKLQFSPIIGDTWSVIESTVITQEVALSGMKVVKRMNVGDRVRQIGPFIFHEGAKRMKVTVEWSKIPTEGEVIGYITIDGTKGTQYIRREDKRKADEEENPQKKRKVEPAGRLPRYLVVGERCTIVEEENVTKGTLESWSNDKVTVYADGTEKLIEVSPSKLRCIDGSDCRMYKFDEAQVDDVVRDRISALEDIVEAAWVTFNDANDRLDAGAPDADKLLREEYPKMQNALDRFKAYCDLRYMDVETIELTSLIDAFQELIAGHNEKQKKINQVYAAFLRDSEIRAVEKAHREIEEKKAEDDRRKKEAIEKRRVEIEKHKAAIDEANDLVDSTSEMKMTGETLLETLKDAAKIIEPAVAYLQDTKNANHENGNLLMQAIKLKTRIERLIEDTVVETATPEVVEEPPRIREPSETSPRNNDDD